MNSGIDYTDQDIMLGIIRAKKNKNDNEFRQFSANILRIIDVLQTDNQYAVEALDQTIAAQYPLSYMDLQSAQTQKGIIDTGTGREAYRFAAEFQCADISALQDVVVERGTGLDALKFANDVPGADRDRLLNFAMNTGYTAFIKELMDHVRDWIEFDDIDINYNKLMDELEDHMFCVPVTKLAMYIKENSDNHKSVLESGRAYFDQLIRFAQNTDSCELQPIQAFFERYADPSSIIELCKNVNGIDIQSAEDIILRYGSARDIYLFASEVENADLQAVHEKLVELDKDGLGFWYLDAFNQDTSVQIRMAAQAAPSSECQASLLKKPHLRT